jgi:hypothetical protein
MQRYLCGACDTTPSKLRFRIWKGLIIQPKSKCGLCLKAPTRPDCAMVLKANKECLPWPGNTIGDSLAQEAAGDRHDTPTGRNVLDWIGVQAPGWTQVSFALTMRTCTLENDAETQGQRTQGNRMEGAWPNHWSESLVGLISFASHRTKRCCSLCCSSCC